MLNVSQVIDYWIMTISKFRNQQLSKNWVIFCRNHRIDHNHMNDDVIYGCSFHKSIQRKQAAISKKLLRHCFVCCHSLTLLFSSILISFQVFCGANVIFQKNIFFNMFEKYLIFFQNFFSIFCYLRRLILGLKLYKKCKVWELKAEIRL